MYKIDERARENIQAETTTKMNSTVNKARCWTEDGQGRTSSILLARFC